MRTRLPSGLLAIIGAAGLAAATPVPAPAPASAATGATAAASGCALTGGTAGSPETGAGRDLPDRGNGLARGARTNAPATLPARLVLRTTRTTFNRRYWFALQGGRIWFRSNADVTHIVQPWAELATPACLAGNVIGISADDDELVAIDRGRQILTMDGALGDPALFNWTSRWGPPVWTGPGRTLPAGNAWSWSVVSQLEDGNWTDPAGNRHQIGAGKVSHVWELRDRGRTLTFMDPWLPDDESYAMCGPHRGRFRAVALSASGSTIFVAGRSGDLFTRIYDFDLAGDDSLFFSYSYDDQRGKANPAIQLPTWQWVHQPKIPGRITSAISIEKQGRDVVHRTLRVEGRDARGRSGYWEKDITALSPRAWRFHASGLPLQGRPLANPRGDTSGRGLAPPPGAGYELTGAPGGLRARLRGFDGVCSPTPLVVALPRSRIRLHLLLHTTDTIRQTPRAATLDSNPHALDGAIEAPPSVLRDRRAAVRAFVAATLRGRFTPAKVSATRDALVLGDQGWRFSRARPPRS